MPSTPSERSRRGRPGPGPALPLLLVAGCAFAPAPARPRPTLPPPPLAAPAAQIESVAVHELLVHGDGTTTGTLTGAGEQVHFTLRRAGGGGRPLVLIVPILAGGAELVDSVGTRLLGHGFDVVSCARAGRALQAGDRGRELDELFRRTVLQQRLLLAWLRRSGPPPATFVLGLSLGGMVATVLAAQEPTVDGVAICLSGGDIGGLIPVSSERRVQSWRRWRHEQDGVGDDHVLWELNEYLRHEPLRFAPAIETRDVLLVEAAFDTVVPTRHQDLLWEALGRPARFTVPLGHYTAALAIDPILSAVADHFRRQH